MAACVARCAGRSSPRRRASARWPTSTSPATSGCATVNPATTAFIELRAAELTDLAGSPTATSSARSGDAAISAALKRAVLVAEDDAFWQHEGVDLDQIKESIERDLECGLIWRGGSTITQQLAKNLVYCAATTTRPAPPRYRPSAGDQTPHPRYLLERRRVGRRDLWRRCGSAGAFFRSAPLNSARPICAAGALVNPRVMDAGRPSTRLLRRQPTSSHWVGDAAAASRAVTGRFRRCDRRAR